MKSPSRLPRSFLGANKKIGYVSTPISKIELTHAVSAGITLRMLDRGLVPLYEEHAARIESGIRLAEWSEMAEKEKALIIAARRISFSLKNLQEEAQIAESERKINQAKRK